MPVFVQLVSSFSTSGKFDVRNESALLNTILKRLQDKGAKILDLKLGFGNLEHVTTVVYMIMYEAQKPVEVYERK